MTLRKGGDPYLNLVRQILVQGSQGAILIPEFETKKNNLLADNFLSKFQQVLDLSDQIVVAALVLIRNLTRKQVRLTNSTICKLLVTCIVIVEKLFDDQEHSLESFSLTTGLPMKELIKLEHIVVDLLNFDFQIDQREFRIALEKIDIKTT